MTDSAGMTPEQKEGTEMVINERLRARNVLGS
jgi:hypothetical protein